MHARLTQGHTQLGQPLGSAAAFGGGAAVFAIDHYTPRGRSTLSWSRMLRAEYLNAVPDPKRADVFHEFSWNGILFHKRSRLDLTYELSGTYEMNRDFGADAGNVRVGTGIRYLW